MTTIPTAKLRVVAIVLLAIVMSGCEAVETIFQAGVWAGVILVVLVLGLIGFVAAKVRRS